MKLQFLPGECWYGACVKYGMQMPLRETDEIFLDFTYNATPNQAMPCLLSSKGRYLWSEHGFSVTVKDGWLRVPDTVKLYVTGASRQPDAAEGEEVCVCTEQPERTEGGTLRTAYLAAMRRHFPFHGRMPARELFEKTIYNTWIELLFDQNQRDILRYAKDILASGMEPGVLMIDDGWAESYGDWRFHGGKFPDAASMLAQLHALGFSVMVWVCPFVSADTVRYREARDRQLLLCDDSGEPCIVRWWNGYSAVLDLTNPQAEAWLHDQLSGLRALGVDGFKFDAGDSIYYRRKSADSVSADEHSRLWAAFGERYALNEYRAAAKAGGMALLQRLCDKEHAWGGEGVASLVPDTLAQGLLGYPFGCPDMVGGGEYLNFCEAAKTKLDGELFVRHCEIACLMPAIQFSAAPWRVLDEADFAAVKRSLAFRKRFLPYLLSLLEEAAKTGEPAVRYLAYEFPESGAEEITDQFMLGSRYLVAPVCKKGAAGRMVFVPRGRWRYGDALLEGEDAAVYLETQRGIPAVLERESAS